MHQSLHGPRVQIPGYQGVRDMVAYGKRVGRAAAALPPVDGPLAQVIQFPAPPAPDQAIAALLADTVPAATLDALTGGQRPALVAALRALQVGGAA